MLETMVTYSGGPVWVSRTWEALTVGTNYFQAIMTDAVHISISAQGSRFNPPIQN